MVKRKPNEQTPQACHKNNSTPSQHDRRDRLLNTNDARVQTESARVPLVGAIAVIAASVAAVLDVRSAFRFPIILAGMFLAKGRRTASTWLRAAGVRDDWDRFYDAIASVGRYADSIGTTLLRTLLKQLGLDKEGQLVIALDDSPTKRYGRHVEAANIHHNPTPGPGDSQWLYGHNWVCLALLVRHSLWGIIALPVLSRLYVREKDTAKLNEKYGWEFRTKIELGIELVKQLVGQCRWLNKAVKFLLVVDCAYATKDFLKETGMLGVTVVSRLRKNACLFDLPAPRQPGQRGRPRKRGINKLDLNQLANDPSGWEPLTYNRRGILVHAKFKTFLATNSIAEQPIRIVMITEEGKHWAALFSTDTAMGAKSIVEAYASRWGIEECFQAMKEVWRSGEQQVRNVWSNVACWQLNCWAYILAELECWNIDSKELVDRRDRPWDNPARRPSHADRRRWIAGKMLSERFSAELKLRPNDDKLKALIQELLTLAA
jgi:hypothetical protein